jgi:hypothetical protein
MWDSFGAELVEDQLDSSLLLPYSSLDVQESSAGTSAGSSEGWKHQNMGKRPG